MEYMFMMREGRDFMMMRRIIISEKHTPLFVHIVESIFWDIQIIMGLFCKKCYFKNRGINKNKRAF